MISHTSHHKRKLKKAAHIESLTQTLHRRSFDPAWQIQNASAGHDRMRHLDPSSTVFVAFGDITNLKLWNTAFGAQPPLDTIFAAAFASVPIRACDIFCRFDGGDQLAIVITETESPDYDRRRHVDIARMADRINSELESAAIPVMVAKRYIRLACQKRYGTTLGRIRATLGWHTIPAHPHIDWVIMPPTSAESLVQTIKDTNAELFKQKG